MNLNLPLDFESTPEFWQLCENIQEVRLTQGAPSSTRLNEMAATFLWLRLWISLGYLAKSTNKPGHIGGDGMRRFEQSLDPIFAEDVAHKVLSAGSTPLLVLVPGCPTPAWTCPLFAKLNAHTAGDYKPGHIVGNQRSRLSAARKVIERDAPVQAQLLPPDIFQHKDGRTMDAALVRSCTKLIMTVDRCRMAPPRGFNAWTAGLMADAGDVVERYGDRAEEMDEFYNWLLESGGKHPNVPKTTEEILADFDTTFALSRK